MSLKVYAAREEVPEGIEIIDYNDDFFNANTLLNNSEFEKVVLSSIDKARFQSAETFIGRTERFGGLSTFMLSTGSKTLLNIEKNPNICFNVCECGNNALCLLPLLSKGNVLWENPVAVYRGSGKCDIEYKGKKFTNFYNLLGERMRDDR
jgi:hypothetical protein